MAQRARRHWALSDATRTKGIGGHGAENETVPQSCGLHTCLHGGRRRPNQARTGEIREVTLRVR